MCWRSASEYRLYAGVSSEPVRTILKPSRSLVEILRELFRPRRRREVQAKVVRFPVGRRAGTGEAVDRRGPEAA